MDNRPQFIEHVSTVYNAGREEARAASIGKKALFASLVAGLAFEWSTGNEALLGYVGTHAYEHTHNSLETGVFTGLTSAAEQSLLGLNMALNLRAFPKVMDRVRMKLNPDRATITERSLGKRALMAFALGSSAVVLNDGARDKQRFAQSAKTAIGYSSVIGAGVGVIASSAASIATYGAKHGYESEAQNFVDIVSNPNTYLGLFALSLGVDYTRKVVKNHSKHVKFDTYLCMEMIKQKFTGNKATHEHEPAQTSSQKKPVNLDRYLRWEITKQALKPQKTQQIS